MQVAEGYGNRRLFAAGHSVFHEAAQGHAVAKLKMQRRARDGGVDTECASFGRGPESSFAVVEGYGAYACYRAGVSRLAEAAHMRASLFILLSIGKSCVSGQVIRF
jgi:hypothetical protein